MMSDGGTVSPDVESLSTGGDTIPSMPSAMSSLVHITYAVIDGVVRRGCPTRLSIATSGIIGFHRTEIPLFRRAYCLIVPGKEAV